MHASTNLIGQQPNHGTPKRPLFSSLAPTTIMQNNTQYQNRKGQGKEFPKPRKEIENPKTIDCATSTRALGKSEKSVFRQA